MDPASFFSYNLLSVRSHSSPILAIVQRILVGRASSQVLVDHRVVNGIVDPLRIVPALLAVVALLALLVVVVEALLTLLTLLALLALLTERKHMIWPEVVVHSMHSAGVGHSSDLLLELRNVVFESGNATAERVAADKVAQQERFGGMLG